MGKMTKDEKGGVGVILGQILADVICERSLRPERSALYEYERRSDLDSNIHAPRIQLFCSLLTIEKGGTIHVDPVKPSRLQYRGNFHLFERLVRSHPREHTTPSALLTKL